MKRYKLTAKQRLSVLFTFVAFLTALITGGRETNTADANNKWAHLWLLNPPLTPTPLPVTVLLDAVFDPAPGSHELPRRVRNMAVNAPLSEPNVSAMPRIPGQTPRVDLDTLVVIYTNTAMGSITDDDITRLQQEISKTAIFIWRHSHLKLRLNIAYCIISNYKDITEFTQTSPGSYWLFPGDDDDDGESVENDLKARGVQRDQYDSINYFWAHNGPHGVAYGGLGGGIWWSLGLTGITEIPIAWWFWGPEGSTAFAHEIQHTIDFMFEWSGYPEYFFPDRPWDLSGAFGESWDFWASGMERWPIENWFALRAPWGTIVSQPDADNDGVPDLTLGEFPTEATLGSSPTLRDSDGDRLEDLDEVLAGIFRNSSPTISDSDADGLVDGDDRYPLYAIDTQVVYRIHALDGNLSQWDLLNVQLTEQNAPLSASIAMNWDQNFLYIMVTVDRYAGLHIMIDADNDGWFHGRDNYELRVDPSYPNPTDPHIVGCVHIWDCSDEIIAARGIPMWDDEPNHPGGRLVRESDIGRYARAYGSGFLVQLAIPRNITTGMDFVSGSEIGLLATFIYLDRRGDTYARLWERDAWVRLILVTARDTTPPNSWMNMLPPVIYDTSFVVSWNGTDTGTGLRSYDVQYRDGPSGQWVNWLRQTTTTTATFTGQPGYKYYFRTRAWDKAWNVEVYPAGDGDTWTEVRRTYRLYLPVMLR